MRDPWSLVGQVRNAGGIFVGEHSFEVLGDYVAGPSHVMPTEGSARYASPLSVADFVKRISLVALDAEAGARLSAPAAVLARGEGLTAHAAAAEMRVAQRVDRDAPPGCPPSERTHEPLEFERLLLPHIAEMEPYTPILPFEVLSRQLGREPREIVKLDANENPYGPHRAVREALASYPFLHIYPDPEQRELRAALADYAGVPAENILPGHGADELIDLLPRIMAGPGRRDHRLPADLRHVQLRRRAGRRAGGRACRGATTSAWMWTRSTRQRPATPGRKAALPHLAQQPGRQPARPRATCAACSACRCSSSWTRPTSSSPGWSTPSCDWVLEHENLIVLRTFSKWAGIAGLRLGYGIFPAWLMPHLWKAKQPYNVNVAATVAGLASLAHRDEIQPTVDALIRERERLLRRACRASRSCSPSRATPTSCSAGWTGRDARELKETLAQQGILVRYYAKPGLEN